MSSTRERSTVIVDDRPRSGELTIRETEVLGLVTQGLSNKEIARMLNTTTGTVNGHVHNIIRKLRVANRTQAAIWAIAHGLGGSRFFSQDNTGGDRV